MVATKSSQLSGFYKLSRGERIGIVAEWAQLSDDEIDVLQNGGLSNETANSMIENGISTHALPLGIAANFQLNGKDFLVPMAVEEPSVLAAVSYAAKLARAGGGFQTESSEPIMIGQVQVLDIPDMDAAVVNVEANKELLMRSADSVSQNIVRRGGGSRDIEVRRFDDTPVGAMMIVHLLYDCRDAMGANAVNTAAETIAPIIAELTGGRTNLRILSNLTDRRTATARCIIPAKSLTRDGMDGREVAQRIVEANAFAVVDPYRATTHNKGIMNGIDAVCIATGNDWRAIEAGAHAYAARDGQYRALTNWFINDEGDLVGEMTLPLAVGTVGGATKVHPTAKIAMKILDVSGSQELAEVMACVGLAQNLAAIRALATDGIQKGHMRMHARQVALAAGAVNGQVQRIANQLVSEGNIRVNRAQELVNKQ